MKGRSLTSTRYLLVLSALALTVIGVLFVHSTKATGDESFPCAGAKDHIVRAVVGLAVFVVITRLDYRLLGRYAALVYGVVVALLLVLAVMKTMRADRGVVRWIELPLFQVQPSELMKLALILGLARFLRFRTDQRQLSGLVQPCFLTLIPMILVLAQPDLGTSLMFPPVLLALLFVAGTRLRYVLVALCLGVAALPAAYFLGDRIPVVQDYQRDRLVAYVRQADPEVRQKEAFHLAQSEIALGNGGVLGRGLRKGTQNTYRFLPVRHTDFIFSVIGEEWGFVGTSTVVALVVLMVFLFLRVALWTREPFGRLVATGVAVAFAVQCFQNMGMTMGLTPITGLTLPFVSYGGSSLVSSYVSLGLVLSIASRRVRVVASKDLDPPEIPKFVPVVDDRPAGTLLARWPT